MSDYQDWWWWAYGAATAVAVGLWRAVQSHIFKKVVDPVLSWVSERAPWRRPEVNRQPAEVATPPEPEPPPEPPKKPKPKKARKPEPIPPLKITIPVFIPEGPLRAVDCEFEIGWDVDGGVVTRAFPKCPMCGRVLTCRQDSRITRDPEYCLLECPLCDFYVAVGVTTRVFDSRLKQAAYYHLRQHGRLSS